MKEKQNKKSGRKLFILVLLLAVAFAGGGMLTYSRYTSTSTATDTAKAAKWSVTVDGKDITETENKTIALGDFNATDASKAIITPAEDNTAKNIIAPGFVGTYTIAVKNDSEVPAYISVKTSDLELPETLQNDANLTKKDQITITSDTSTDAQVPAHSSKDVTLTLTWKDNHADTTLSDEEKAAYDSSDTLIGKNTADITITATVTATQQVQA